MKIQASFLTNFGNHRVKNEDSLLVQNDVIFQSQMFDSESRLVDSETSMFCVADGMGGHLGGELASKSVLFYLRDQINQLKSIRNIRNAIHKSKVMLNSIAFETKTFGLGTTISGMIFRKKKAIIFNCGDSRVYKIEGKVLHRLTIDHSVVQNMYNAGLIEEEEMRTHPNKNLLTSAIIGDYTSHYPNIFFKEISISVGDQFFLCTDGLWESMSRSELEKIFCNSKSMDETANRLNEFSLSNGGRDNITLILLEVVSI